MTTHFQKIASLACGQAFLADLGEQGLYALGKLDQARSAFKRARKKLRNATLALEAAQFWVARHKEKISRQRLALELERKKALFDLCAVNIALTQRQYRKLKKAFFGAHPEIRRALTGTRRSSRRPSPRLAA